MAIIFHSLKKNQKIWVGSERVAFNNNIFSTEDNKLASALRDRIRLAPPKGLRGIISEAKPYVAPPPPPAESEVEPEEKPVAKKK